MSPHMESDGFEIVPFLRSIGLIDRKKASNSSAFAFYRPRQPKKGVRIMPRGASGKPAIAWLKRESETVSRHDLELGMTPVMAHAG